MKAIAAMSRNRVIGRAGKMPWDLPEDLQWFKRATLGQVVLMGRRTFESLGGQALPGRLNLVVTRGDAVAKRGVVTIRDLAAVCEEDYAPREIWVAGGAEIYSQMLVYCSELYLSVIDREVEGDTYFPVFEHDFSLLEVVHRYEEFEVRRYGRR